MSQNVTQACNRSPWNFRKLIRYILRKVFNRFSNDFEIAGYCINCAPVFCECLIIQTLNVGFDRKRSIEDILKAEFWITRHEVGRLGYAA